MDSLSLMGSPNLLIIMGFPSLMGSPSLTGSHNLMGSPHLIGSPSLTLINLKLLSSQRFPSFTGSESLTQLLTQVSVSWVPPPHPFPRSYHHHDGFPRCQWFPKSYWLRSVSWVPPPHPTPRSYHHHDGFPRCQWFPKSYWLRSQSHGFSHPTPPQDLTTIMIDSPSLKGSQSLTDLGPNHKFHGLPPVLSSSQCHPNPPPQSQGFPVLLAPIISWRSPHLMGSPVLLLSEIIIITMGSPSLKGSKVLLTQVPPSWSLVPRPPPPSLDLVFIMMASPDLKGSHSSYWLRSQCHRFPQSYYHHDGFPLYNGFP